MPQRSALRADNTMPRTMRAARFFWKMPRYTTSQIRADMGASSTSGRLVGPHDTLLHSSGQEIKHMGRARHAKSVGKHKTSIPLREQQVARHPVTDVLMGSG